MLIILISFILFLSCTKNVSFKAGECIMSPDGIVNKVVGIGDQNYKYLKWEKKHKTWLEPEENDYGKDLAGYFKIECPGAR